MQTLNMNYAKRSLSYSVNKGWCMQRYCNPYGHFWIQLSTKHLICSHGFAA